MSALASSMRVEDAVLISHELVGNAIDHARTQCRVTVRLTASTVRIFVSRLSRVSWNLRWRSPT
jgi:two-component sensor histidine kinase